jgi:serine protease Do
MKTVKKMLALATIGVSAALTYTIGSSLISDVKFARAEEQVNLARGELKTLTDLSSAFKQVNHVMEQSVVHIRVEKKVSARGRMGQRGAVPPQFEEDFRRFFDQDGDGQPDLPEGLREQATGSGVVMEAGNGTAYVVTNNHVVSDANEVDVVLNDGRRLSNVKVVGTDPKTDLAVLKLDTDKVIAAKWGDSGKVEKGDIIVAFGSPFGYVGSMSHGIVSALNRQAGVIRGSYSYENFIQVDAPINPGNSGGPLVNLQGEVIGINTAIATASGSFSGVGFAIPSNQVKTVFNDLKTTGKVTRGYLGVAIADVSADNDQIRDAIASVGFKGDKGVFVREVVSDSPAYDILKPGDVIIKIDGQDVDTRDALRNRIAAMPPGREVKLTVFRDGKTVEETVKLAEQPDDVTVARGPMAPARGGIGVMATNPTADELVAMGLDGDQKGALVKQVAPGSIAARSGIQPGDLITRVDRKPIESSKDLKAALEGADLKTGVRVDIINAQGQKMVTVRQAK